MLFLDGGSTSIRNLLSPRAQKLEAPLDRLWTAAYCLTQPSTVLEWHKSFLAAGSDIITTNTYQLPCQDQLADVCVPKVMLSAVTLAIRAVEEFGSGAVALSLGTGNAITGVKGVNMSRKQVQQSKNTNHITGRKFVNFRRRQEINGIKLNIWLLKLCRHTRKLWQS